MKEHFGSVNTAVTKIPKSIFYGVPSTRIWGKKLTWTMIQICANIYRKSTNRGPMKIMNKLHITFGWFQLHWSRSCSAWGWPGLSPTGWGSTAWWRWRRKSLIDMLVLSSCLQIVADYWRVFSVVSCFK